MRLGLSLFICQFLGALGLAVARYFSGAHRLNAGLFCALAAGSVASCGAALFLVRKPWNLEGFTRRAMYLMGFVYVGLILGAFVAHFAGSNGADHNAARTVVAALSFQGAALVLVHRFLREHELGWAAGFGLFTNGPRARRESSRARE